MPNNSHGVKIVALLTIWVVSLIVAITVYNVTLDPRVLAMRECTKGFPDAERQVACAKEIFGEGKH